MKKQITLIAVLIITCFGYKANAQISLQVNLGVQPLWGPVGYDHASYYYLPDIDAYYDVNNQEYVYFEDGQWVTRPDLPPAYAGYDLYNGYKVVINQPSPWLHAARYRTQYVRYKGHHGQQAIRDSHQDKYRANPNHPEHNQWHGGGGSNAGHQQHGRPQQGQQPQQGSQQHGRPQQGQQPQQGYQQHGQQQQGQQPQAHPFQGHPQQAPQPQGRPQQGRPQQGPPEGGHQAPQPQQGHPQQGHPQQGQPQQQGHPGGNDEHGHQGQEGKH